MGEGKGIPAASGLSAMKLWDESSEGDSSDFMSGCDNHLGMHAAVFPVAGSVDLCGKNWLLAENNRATRRPSTVGLESLRKRKCLRKERDRKFAQYTLGVD